jgi:hypothetical protein
MKTTTLRRFLTTAVLALAAVADSTVPGQAQSVAPTAPAALPGYQVLRGEPVTVDNNARLSFGCPAGKVAVAGGAEVQGPTPYSSAVTPSSAAPTTGGPCRRGRRAGPR